MQKCCYIQLSSLGTAMLKEDLVTQEQLLEFSSWGDENIAFVKGDMLNGREIWVVYSADGVKLASTENRELAYIMAKQNDYEVMSAH